MWDAYHVLADILYISRLAESASKMVTARERYFGKAMVFQALSCMVILTLESEGLPGGELDARIHPTISRLIDRIVA